MKSILLIGTSDHSSPREARRAQLSIADLIRQRRGPAAGTRKFRGLLAISQSLARWVAGEFVPEDQKLRDLSSPYTPGYFARW